MSLFDAAVDVELAKRAPLAARMRPATLDDIVGQRHLLAPGAPLRTLVEADRLSSAVFYGPPGTGKTSVARLVALHTKRRYRALSAVEAGVKDVRSELEDARRALGTDGVGTIMFLDEVHRFNKAQQDALLHGVEDGVVVLIGATTENPFFALNTPLLSRSTLWRFEPLSEEEVCEVARRAARAESAEATDEALSLVADLASGDARVAITVIEVAIALARGAGDPGKPGDEGAASASSASAAASSASAAASSASASAATLVEATHVVQARSMRAFRHGTEEHYNLISALIKSVRGSDPDAGVYWLARLLEVGEDPRFIARRLAILASEDIGMADPMSLVVATAAASAVELVGLPEAALNLSQAVIHLALAPKSNSAATAIWAAETEVRDGPFAAVPPHLRGAGYYGAREVGSGIGYEYPHDDPRGYLDQQYLPDELAGHRYYVPRGHGAEGNLAKRWRERRGEPEPGSSQEETSP
jgi:putative ATPase